MDRELYNLLQPHANWWNDKGEERNQKAREVLYQFYDELLKRKPAKIYEKRDAIHSWYLFHMLHIRKAFEEEKYMRVCHEIITLMHYEPLLQGRIYYNLLKMLETYLHGRGEKHAEKDFGLEQTER
ncbi:hypothetical protein GCM10010965_15060 [Caldalkalibacillus thermarum]|uniref:hypothetical protein n=1 Tax=Caldalkalibacillus thermarum TaxID=296745 RepID=UPI00199130C2|nr:hypothetical protein [Caldalkalibacillus thermarum]GGK23242.1 hypothetical protein GCM10010965_15060 [Caldalkalibacillus thermarum]